MLQFIRGKVGSWFIKILFALLILSFAFWGIGDLFSGGGVRATVATVGDERITVQRLTEAFQSELGRLQQVFGPTLDVQLALNIGLLDQAMDGLVTDSLFSQAAGGLGVQASNEIVVQTLQEEPLFQDSSGRFSRDQFTRFLRATGREEAEFFAERRRELARRELVEAIGAGAAVPDTLAAAMHRYRNETRHYAAILIGPEAVGAVTPPSEAQVEAYYRENEAEFMAPEYRVLRVASLTPEAIAAEIEIAEDDIRAEYDYRLEQYETPEQRAFDQIVVADEATAARIADAAAGGVSLEDAVAAVEGTEASVIPLELAPRAEFLPTLAEAGFALEPGGLSAPVESPFGWHVLRVTEIAEGGIRPYESARPEIEAVLRLERARDTLFEVANEFDDLLASDVPLDEAAAQLGLPITVTGPVARDGSLKGGGVLEGLTTLPQVLETGFTLFDGATSPIEETADEGYYVVRVEQVTAPALRPLDEVREAIVAAWTERQTAAAAEALAEAVAERLDAGEPVAEVATEIGATVLEQVDLRRDGGNRGTLPEPAVDSLFEARIGDVVVAPAPDGQVVARLEAIAPAPAPDAAALDEIAGGQTQAIAGDLLAGFAASLRTRFDIDIDRGAMSRLYQVEQP